MAQARDEQPLSAASSLEEANLRVILDTTTDGIVVVDEVGTICFVNRAAEALFTRSARDLIGDMFGYPLVAGVTVELDAIRPGGETCVVEMRVAPIQWQNRAACLASLRDISERKEAEEERAALIREQAARVEAQAALRARDQFLAAAAHELKTPLTRLRLALQQGKRRLSRAPAMPEDAVQQILRQIDIESAEIARLVDDLLRLPWIENGSFEPRRSPADLCQLVHAVAARPGKQVGEARIAVQAPSAPIMISADRTLVEHLVASAVGNALRASPPGRSIDVQLALQSESHGSEDEWDNTAVLTVRDYGTALPIEDPPHLFGRSFQVYSNAYVSGLGLWLYIGREVMRLHRGQIAVDYPDDGGTRVVVRFPVN